MTVEGRFFTAIRITRRVTSLLTYMVGIVIIFV